MNKVSIPVIYRKANMGKIPEIGLERWTDVSNLEPCYSLPTSVGYSSLQSYVLRRRKYLIYTPLDALYRRKSIRLPQNSGYLLTWTVRESDLSTSLLPCHDWRGGITRVKSRGIVEFAFEATKPAMRRVLTYIFPSFLLSTAHFRYRSMSLQLTRHSHLERDKTCKTTADRASDLMMRAMDICLPDHLCNTRGTYAKCKKLCLTGAHRLRWNLPEIGDIADEDVHQRLV
ncbi:uncharacterized protein BCR38DRAFT_199350 [Pseudomassariella vexata]|uniref:Uncharacterized protein n=1 Tax=Pseudomassariella vexata TaxID=1141098 RepID=A0A1Y2E1V2_9PEZI|nr:uncharacterized protein BCR38DRAFT_199350 [Pseudomassariella vexata]ORY65520.1 hypothetical protein BCR38DRAFT_199350 [Pseudomassariella vexata]